jgi:hypothetical protein
MVILLDTVFIGESIGLYWREYMPNTKGNIDQLHMVLGKKETADC